jgi:polysaccharide pyruvyl transferase WcaK-like protein
LGFTAESPRIAYAFLPLFDRERLWPGMREKFTRYAAACRAMIAWALRETEAEVVLYPFQRPIDEPFLHSLVPGLPGRERVRLVSRELRAAEVAAVLGSCDLVVGSRYHAVLLAAVGGAVPVGIAAHHKTVGLMSSLGVPELTLMVGDGACHPEADLDPAACLAALDAAWRGRVRLAARVRENVERLRRLERLNAERAVRLLVGATP